MGEKLSGFSMSHAAWRKIEQTVKIWLSDGLDFLGFFTRKLLNSSENRPFKNVSEMSYDDSYRFGRFVSLASIYPEKVLNNYPKNRSNVTHFYEFSEQKVLIQKLKMFQTSIWHVTFDS